ncbi:MAG: hypothetical protein OXF09_02695, partial [Hyphomicrobiales bacterium]|nr:hypothetical protein [Hyphomicrobiales bacterium]
LSSKRNRNLMVESVNQPKGRPGISDDLPGRFLRVRPDGISARRRRPARREARKENPQGKNFKV